ncbi:MAG: EamA-like transporter family [Rubrobacteraceae bacterium]|nr:EamA-like transporter family [Rubrobacteraceae bacterium]
MGGRDLGALLLLSALWGASFIFIRVAVADLGPFVLVELRVGLAAAGLAFSAALLRRLPKLRVRWRQFALLGLVNVAIPFSLISAAEINLTASLAAILNSTTVMFTAIVAAVWMGDALTVRKVFGVVLGIIGVTVLVGWDPIAVDWAVILSVGAMLVASLGYALGSVYAKRTFVGSSPLAIATGQLTAASLLMMPLAAVSVPDERPSTIVVLSVLGLALPSTALAYMLYFRLISNVGPTSTSTVTLLVPLFGLVFGVLLLDEPVGLGTLAGLILILSSVTLITGLGFGAKEKSRA